MSKADAMLMPPKWYASVVVALSVTLLVAGQLAVALVAGIWAIAGMLGLPSMVTFVLWSIATIASFAIAVMVFIRAMQVETRKANGQSIDDIPWPFLNTSKINEKD